MLDAHTGATSPIPSQLPTPALRPWNAERADAADTAPEPEVARQLVTVGSGGRRVFQLLVPGGCRHSCQGCPMRAQRFLPAGTETLDGLARLFLGSYRFGRCDGAFLTAGLAAVPVWAAEQLIALAEVLRLRYGFQGYIHAKVPEGATEGQLQRLLHLVDRVSHRPEPACAPMAGDAAVVPPRPSGLPAAIERRRGRGGIAAAAFPVELTTAARSEIRAVPGVGRRGVERLLASRAAHGGTLAAFPLPARSRGLVTLHGRLVGLSRQASLFEDSDGSRAGTPIASMRRGGSKRPPAAPLRP